MQLVVDISTGELALLEPNEMDGFAVVVTGGDPGEDVDHGALGAVAAALSVHDAGIVQPDESALIAEDAVARIAAQQAVERNESLDPAWRDSFTGMLESAAADGWMSEDGFIRSHVEWKY